MEKHINQIVEFIKNSTDFKFLDITSSYDYKFGDSFSFTVDNSRNLTNNNMGATIIDGILQAGLNYENVVKPRVIHFKNEYREYTTTSQFYHLINSNDLSEIIKMKGQKIDRINVLTKFLVEEKVETEDDFYEWLTIDTNILRLSNIKGIKTKTVEYFKILTGHKNTVAIDTRLRKFIKMCCDGLEITNDQFAKELLLKVAEKLKVEPATLDYSIWSYMNSKKISN